MKKAVVVIPYASNNLNEIEKISISQAIKVLSSHDIVLVTPDNIELESNYRELKQIRVPSCFFGSIDAHNRLLSSVFFYELFSDYEYMLLYHLDAFVFSDKLIQFCDLGYDFIGAPAPKTYWMFLDRRIGNGGFSLRRISSYINVMKNSEEIFRLAESRFSQIATTSMKSLEDQLIGYCGQIGWRGFSIPDESIAFQFSVEFNIDGVYQGIKEHLPFGCHRWHKYRLETWWPIISTYGYTLSPKTYSELIENQVAFEEHVLKYLLDREEYSSELKEAFRTVLGSDTVRLWGYGFYGKKVLTWLRKAEIVVDDVFDLNNELIDEPFVNAPSDERIKRNQHVIIITTSKYEEEISEILIKYNEIAYLSLNQLTMKLKKVLQIDIFGEKKVWVDDFSTSGQDPCNTMT